MRILKKQDIEDILFIDIETAPIEETLETGSPLWDAWEYTCIKNGEEDIAGSYAKTAALHAEFGRIVCITIGAVRDNKIILKSFDDVDEKTLLENFNASVSKFVTNKTFLCGHAVIAFDAPFIMKRCLINDVDLHIILDTAHLKPWEVSYLDTAVLWKGTGFKTSSLISVATALGLPSPKDDISGADVGAAFFRGEIDRIVHYCEKDVITVINIVRRLRGEEPLSYDHEAIIEQKPLGLMEYIYRGGEVTKEILSKIKEEVSKMNKTDKTRAAAILNALPSRAKGKETFITKKDIKEIFND